MVTLFKFERMLNMISAHAQYDQGMLKAVRMRTRSQIAIIIYNKFQNCLLFGFQHRISR